MSEPALLNPPNKGEMIAAIRRALRSRVDRRRVALTSNFHPTHSEYSLAFGAHQEALEMEHDIETILKRFER